MGFGKLLVRDAEERIKQLKFSKFYLFTEDRETWYAKLGKLTIEHSFFENDPVAIMEKTIL